MATRVSAGSAKHVRRLILSALVVIASGCVRPSGQETTDDIGFVEGCWVGRDVHDGSLLMSLRLFPDATEDGAFAGTVVEPDATEYAPTHFSFARDGSALTVQNPESFGARTPVRIPRSEPPPSSLAPTTDEISRQVAAFGDGAESGWIVVVVARREDGGDHMAIYFVHPTDDPGEMYFGGVRETCS